MMLIRPVRPEEAGYFSELSDSVGWNIAPAECALLTRGGAMRSFFAEVDGEIAGSIGMVCYEPRLTVFINMVIVKPEFRRRGIATALVEHVLEVGREYRTFKLHATPEGSKVYAKLGFLPRRSLSFFAADKPDFSQIADPSRPLRALTARDLEALAARDRTAFGANRKELLEFNLAAYPELALAAGNGRGFILGRRWKKYRQLTMLEADDLATAADLAAGAAALDVGQTLSIIVYDQQTEFQTLLGRAGFAKVRGTLDMELGQPAPAPGADYYAIYGGDMG